jgi:predicted ABC-type ATPase
VASAVASNLARVFRIIAGPNGAGKSTYTSLHNFGCVTLDPDKIAKSIDLPVRQRMLQAGRTVHQETRRLLNSDESFAIETTLAGRTVFRTLAAAKSKGMFIELHFIGLSSLALSQLRVSQGFKLGGHGIPLHETARRYPRIQHNLPRCLRSVDIGFIIDNSSEKQFILAMTVEKGTATLHDNSIPWVNELNQSLVQLNRQGPFL